MREQHSRKQPRTKAIPLAAARANARITSYNVCYTKLLRGIHVDTHAVKKMEARVSYNFV